MLTDNFGRRIDYLRVSVTDRCNLRCRYCMPAEGIAREPQGAILSFEEICMAVRAAAGLGVRKIRITGGEPLVRKDLDSLVRKLRLIPRIEEIALTTNGMYLKYQARSLKAAGLDRVNISLDTLVPEKFRAITRGGDLDAVKEGIESAFTAGLLPVKINTVLIKGFNDGEIAGFAALTASRAVHVRFIEYMPANTENGSFRGAFFPALKAREICQSLGPLSPVRGAPGATARVFRIGGFCGTVGFISPISEPFCSSCNKLRLTSIGKLRSCLISSRAVDLRRALAGEDAGEELRRAFEEAAASKPPAHDLPRVPPGAGAEKFSMCGIGG